MATADMLVQDLVKRLPLIRELQNFLWQDSPQPQDRRVPIDELVAHVAQKHGLRIEMRSVPFTARHLVSLVERQSSDSFLIAVREDAAFVERRYGVVKELCHIIGDTPEDFQPHGERTLEGIIKLNTAQLYDKTLDLGGDRPAVQSEKRAERMADELMYDRRLRRPDARRVRETSITMAELANSYGIPGVVMTRLMRPLAHELMHSLWREAGFNEPA